MIFNYKNTITIFYTAFSKAKELGINLLLGGHYRTEVFGVKETAKMLEKEFKEIECKFIDCPSGM